MWRKLAGVASSEADPSVPIAALADVLGHKDWRTTMRYAHATEDAKTTG